MKPSEYLSQLDANYCNPRTYAESMAIYLKNKAAIVNQEYAAILQSTTIVDSEGFYFNPDTVLEYMGINVDVITVSNGDADIINPDQTILDTVEWSNETPPTELTSIINEWKQSAISTGESIAPWIDVYRAVAYNLNGCFTPSDKVIRTANVNILVSIDDFSSISKQFSSESQSIVNILEGIASGAVSTVEQMLSEGQALVGELVNSQLFQSVVGIMEATGDNITDTVRAIGSMFSKAGLSLATTANDNTGLFTCESRIGDYTGYSSLGAFAASEVTVFDTAAQAIGQAFTAVGTVFEKIFDWGARVVNKVVDKVGSLFSNPVIDENGEYERDTFDFPVYSMKVARSKVQDGTFGAKTCFGPFNSSLPYPMSVTYDQFAKSSVFHQNAISMSIIMDYLQNDQAIALDMKFGVLYMYKSHDTYNGVEDDYYCFELYAIPTRPVYMTTDEYGAYGLAMYCNSSTGPSYGGGTIPGPTKTLLERLQFMFPDDANDIAVDGSYFWNQAGQSNLIACIRASVLRMWMYWWVRSMAAAADNDTILSATDWLFVMYDGSGVFKLWVPRDWSYPDWTNTTKHYQLFTTDGITDYNVSSFFGKIFYNSSFDVANLTNKQVIEQTCITYASFSKGVGVFGPSAGDGQMDINSSTFSAMSLFFAGLINGVLTQIISNKFEWMKNIYTLTQSFPIFIPYTEVSSMYTSRWHLKTDRELMDYGQRLKNLLVTVATIIAIVAAAKGIKYVINRKLNGKLEAIANKAEAARYEYQDIQSAYNSGSPYAFYPAGQYNFNKGLNTRNPDAQQMLSDFQVHAPDQYDALYEAITQSGSYTISVSIAWVPSINEVNQAKKDYLKSARSNKIKSKVLQSLGAEAISYDYYDMSEDDTSEQVANNLTNSDLCNDIITLIHG